MAQVIKIKRSSSTATPTSLAQGEIAYSSNSDKLFIGNPGTGDVTVIGGKTYINMLDHAAGTLTANSAVIVDGSSEIDNWNVGTTLNVDNLRLSGNAIISTNTNGNITITPNGTGDLVLDGQNWPQADGSANEYLKTNGSGQLSWAAIPSGTITLSDGSATDTYTTGETLTFTGGTGLTSAVTDNTVTLSITALGVDTAQIAADAVTTAKIAENAVTGTELSSAAVATANLGDLVVTTGKLAANAVTNAKIADNAVDTAELVDNSVTNAKLADNAVDTAELAADAVTGDKIEDDAINSEHITDGSVDNVHLANASLTIGSTTTALGATSASLAGLTKVTSTDFVGDLGKADASGTDQAGSALTIKGGAGTGSGAGGSVLIQVADGGGSGSSVNSHVTALTIADDKTVTAAHDVVVTGNLTVSGTTTTVNSETVTFDDNILILNNNFSGSSPTENGGLEVERGTVDNAKFLFNETTDKWQVGIGSTMSNLLTGSNFETEITSIDGGSF